jgi:putative tricarboxylic transport membrane protein
VLVGVCGLIIASRSLLRDGDGIGRVSLRGSIFVLGGAVAFGLAVRPLGLLVAGPLVMLIVTGASRDPRWLESVIFAAVLTVFCIALFRFGLSQAIPVAPWLIGY